MKRQIYIVKEKEDFDSVEGSDLFLIENEEDKQYTSDTINNVSNVAGNSVTQALNTLLSQINSINGLPLPTANQFLVGNSAGTEWEKRGIVGSDMNMPMSGGSFPYVATWNSWNQTWGNPAIATVWATPNTIPMRMGAGGIKIGPAIEGDDAVQLGQLQTFLSAKENLLTAGTNITIDRTDPNNPVISATGGGSLTSDDVSNESNVTGATVTNALETLNAQLDNYIPLSGTGVGKPITDNSVFRLEEGGGGRSFNFRGEGNDGYGFSNIGFVYGVPYMGISLDDDNSNSIIGVNTKINGLYVSRGTDAELSTFIGLSGSHDFSSIVPENKLVYAQRQYVDTALEDYIEEPTSEGTNGQVLTTDGAGGRTWTTVSGGTPTAESVNQTILTQYTESTVSGTTGSNLIQPDLGLPILEVEDLQEDSSYSGEIVLNIENNNIATTKVIELFKAEIYNNTNSSADITAKITFTLNFFNRVGNYNDYKLSWEYLSSGEVLFGEYTDTIDNTSGVDFELIVTGHSTDNFNLKKARLWRN